METLSRDGKEFSSLDLDCAALGHSVLTPGTQLPAASLTKVNAAKANFSGVDFTGSIMSASNFDSTNFSNADLGASIPDDICCLKKQVRRVVITEQMLQIPNLIMLICGLLTWLACMALLASNCARQKIGISRFVIQN